MFSHSLASSATKSGAILTPVLEGTLYKIIGKSTVSAIALK